MKKTKPWKQNIRIISEVVQEKVAGLPTDSLVVAVIKRISADDLATGLYSHLLITTSAEGISLPDRIIPLEGIGKYSRMNVNGWEVIRKDLPLETFYTPVETPNFGDSSRGTHTVYLPYQKYPRDSFAPHEFALTFETVGRGLRNGHPYFDVKVSMEGLLNRTDPDFAADLLFQLNLLQENVGASDVFSTDATREDYLGTRHVTWDLLPVGTLDDQIKVFTENPRLPPAERVKIAERFLFLRTLNPIQIVVGSDGFRRYLGFLFDEHLIAFENPMYGNALYVMYQNWEALSRLSRVELLRGGREGFVRIVHSAQWEARTRQLIRPA